MKLKLFILFSIAISLLSACDFEAPRSYVIKLSPSQQLHVVKSSASGTAKLNLVKEKQGDYTANILRISGSYKNMSGPVTSVTLNGPAFSDKEGPVIFRLKPKEGNTPGSGTFSGEKDLNDNQIHMYIGKQTYINIKTTKYQKGELRGQVTD